MKLYGANEVRLRRSARRLIADVLRAIPRMHHSLYACSAIRIAPSTTVSVAAVERGKVLADPNAVLVVTVTGIASPGSSKRPKKRK